MARRRPSIEQDWREAATSTSLLSLLYPDHRTPKHPSVRRKLRLVLCGAARTIWDRLPHDDLRRAVEVAERFADGRASRGELEQARIVVTGRRLSAEREQNERADPALVDQERGECERAALGPLAECWYTIQAADYALACCGRSMPVARLASWVLEQFPKLSAPMASWEAALPFGWLGVEVGPDPAAAVVRDVFGGPTPVRFADGWKTSTVTAIAEGIAADGAFDRLPVLADALEDAGCESLLVLAHCRGPVPHWRGCWVVDGVLGK